MQQCAFQCLTLMHCQRVMKSVEQEARLSGHSWAFGQPRELAGVYLSPVLVPSLSDSMTVRDASDFARLFSSLR